MWQYKLRFADLVSRVLLFIPAVVGFSCSDAPPPAEEDDDTAHVISAATLEEFETELRGQPGACAKPWKFYAPCYAETPDTTVPAINAAEVEQEIRAHAEAEARDRKFRTCQHPLCTGEVSHQDVVIEGRVDPFANRPKKYQTYYKEDAVSSCTGWLDDQRKMKMEALMLSESAMPGVQATFEQVRAAAGYSYANRDAFLVTLQQKISHYNTFMTQEVDLANTELVFPPHRGNGYPTIRCKGWLRNVPVWPSCEQPMCGLAPKVYRHRLVQPDYPRSRRPGNPLVAALDCSNGRGKIILESPPGLTLAQLSAQNPIISDPQYSPELGYYPPWCPTSDDLPLTTDHDIRVRFDQNTRTEHELGPQLSAQSKEYVDHTTRTGMLLYEVYGGQLASRQRTIARYSYTRSISPLRDEARTAEVRLKMDRCRELTADKGGLGNALLKYSSNFRACDALRDHGSPSAMEADVGQCLSAYHSLMGLRDRTGPTVETIYNRGVALNSWQGLAVAQEDVESSCMYGVSEGWDKRFIASYLTRSKALTPSESESLASIRSRLAMIDMWYRQRKATNRRVATAAAAAGRNVASELQDALVLDTRELVSAFWTGLSNRERPSAGQTRSSIAEAGSNRDRLVLLSIFQKPSPAPAPREGRLGFYEMLPDLVLPHEGQRHSAAVLLAISDALQGMMDSLKGVSVLHDFACRYAADGCGTAQARRSSKTSQMWNLLGAVHDSAALAVRLREADLLRADPWYAVFKEILDNHRTLEDAAREAQDVSPAAQAPLAAATFLVQPSTGHVGTALQHRLSEARMYAQRYAASGLFTSNTANELAGGLTIRCDRFSPCWRKRRQATLQSFSKAKREREKGKPPNPFTV